ncbi:MAG: hypothetical protein ACE5I1_29820, partial [bacterium]
NAELKRQNKYLHRENIKLRQQRDSLQVIVDQMKNDADYYYKLAIEKRNEKFYSESNKLLSNMLQIFPTSRLAPKAKILKRKNDKDLRLIDEAEKRALADLEVVDFLWRNSMAPNWVEARGRVKNISGNNLKNVMAHITWEDKEGNFITSNSALIDLNPILPGQVSTFGLMVNYNPAMHSAILQFKYLMGGSIPTYQKK